MGRRPRTVSKTGYYHVVTRGNRRARVFQQPADYTTYQTLLHDACQAWAVQVAHFCLMTNHVHLLLGTQSLTALSRAMHQIQRRYWFYVRRQYGWTGHLWQGRYHSFPIEDEAYLLEAARYIERNPLEAKLVAQLEDYPWSSYPSYVSGQPAPISLTPTPTYEALGTMAAARQQVYRRFVETPQPYDRSMRRKLHLATAYA